MNKLKNIVVGVDFSNRARCALSEAARLARANQSRLRVAHVVEEEAAEDLAEHERRDLAEIRGELMNCAVEMMDKWQDGIDLPKGSECRITYGHPIEELIGQVNEVNADVLIVGVRGIINEAEGAGAQASRLVRRAPCKVLLVEDGQTQSFQSAVACVDFSPTSKLVVEQAIHMADLDGSELHFLHVYTAPWHKFSYLFGSRYSSEFRDSYVDELEKKLRDFVGDFGKAKVSFHLQHEQHRGLGIGLFCAEKNADLVIIGTRGRTSLKYLLMGSTAEYLLSKRPCSLLAVRPPEE